MLFSYALGAVAMFVFVTLSIGPLGPDKWKPTNGRLSWAKALFLGVIWPIALLSMVWGIVRGAISGNKGTTR